MERELPKYRLGETDFAVDVKNRLLIDIERPENELKLDDLQFFQGSYIAYLDSDARNAVQTGKPGTEHQLPQMVVLDPEGMAELYGKTVEEIRNMTDFDLIVNQDVFKRRMDGVSPEVDILGTTFFADAYEGLLSSENSSIMLYELEPYLKGDFYEFPYNSISKTFTDLDFENITSIPENTFWIRMPLDWELDPVGHARLIGADPKDMCRMYPPKEKITAEVIAWDATKIYEIIASNRKRKQAEGHGTKPEKKSEVRRRRRGI